MPFKPGQSGNPKGRPPKKRALTQILERAGSTRRLDIDGKQRSGKHIIARALWELATTGRTLLQDGEEQAVITVGGKDWFDVLKWLYAHIDGPPRGELDITSNGEAFDISDWQQKRRERLEGIDNDIE